MELLNLDLTVASSSASLACRSCRYVEALVRGLLCTTDQSGTLFWRSSCCRAFSLFWAAWRSAAKSLLRAST